MNVHAFNLVIALDDAIGARVELEKKMRYSSRSAILQGWIDTRNALIRGEAITLIPVDNTNDEFRQERWS